MSLINPLLHGRSAPKGVEVRKFEQPWHRAAAYHFAKGMGVKEVAEANGVTPQTVTQLLKNEWFQSLVTSLMAEAGMDAVTSLLKAEGLNSVQTLITLRDAEDTPKHVKANIAMEILNRTHGKAVQRVESEVSHKPSSTIEEVRRLEEENNRLRKSL